MSEGGLPRFSNPSAPSHSHRRHHGTKPGRGGGLLALEVEVRGSGGAWGGAHGCGQRGESGETVGSWCFFQERIPTWTPALAPGPVGLEPAGAEVTTLGL